MSRAEYEARALARDIDALIEAWIEARKAEGGLEVITAHTIHEEVMAKGAFLTPWLFIDGEAHTIQGWTLNNPIEYGTQAVLYAERITPTGQRDKQAIVIPDSGHKADGSSGAQSGTEAIVLGTGHALQSEPRPVSVFKAVLPGWAHPYPAGQVQLGREGAHIPDGGGPPPPPAGGEGMTIAEYAEALAEPTHPLTVALGKLIKNKGREGIAIEIDEQGLLKVGHLEGGSQLPGAYAAFLQLKSTSFQGGLASLRTAGLYRGPLPGEPGWPPPGLKALEATSANISDNANEGAHDAN